MMQPHHTRSVMPGLVPGIQWGAAAGREALLDCRDKPGNDERETDSVLEP